MKKYRNLAQDWRELFLPFQDSSSDQKVHLNVLFPEIS
jgi:hypothetical protein